MHKGIGVSEGYAIGIVYTVEDSLSEIKERKSLDSNAELGRLAAKLQKYVNALKDQIQDAQTNGNKELEEILLTHLQIARDQGLQNEVISRVHSGLSGENALIEVRDLYIERLSASDVEFVRSKASDIRDACNRVLELLLDVKMPDISHVRENTVIVAKEVSPSLTASIKNGNIVGIVTEVGGLTSHSAIIAKSKDLPAVFSVKGIMDKAHNGDTIIVDGSGTVILNPTKEQLDKYIDLLEEYRYEKSKPNDFCCKPTVTKDGERITLCINSGTITMLAGLSDSDGVGLLRTEYIFMREQEMPDEEKQFREYKAIAEALEGKKAAIRTLDVGGDKHIPYFNIKKEENPYMGLRALRFFLKNEKVSRTQLRALLRASAYGNIFLTLPMVVEMEEIRKVKQLLKELMVELDLESIPYNKNIKTGVVIETAAGSLMADLIAKESDFISIGSNDLTAYTMAADRGNSEVAYLYSTFQPAVLRSIKHIIDCAVNANKPVGICGEAAADPLLIPVFLGFGMKFYSVAPSKLLSTRAEISRWTIAEAKEIAQKVMTMDNADDIKEYLNDCRQSKKQLTDY